MCVCVAKIKQTVCVVLLLSLIWRRELVPAAERDWSYTYTHTLSLSGHQKHWSHRSQFGRRASDRPHKHHYRWLLLLATSDVTTSGIYLSHKEKVCPGMSVLLSLSHTHTHRKKINSDSHCVTRITASR